MFSNDKTVKHTALTPGILFIATIKHHGKKQQNLSKFEAAIRIACAGCRSASSLVTGKYSDRAAQEYLIFLMMKRNFAGAVSSSTKVSGECFHVVFLRKLI